MVRLDKSDPSGMMIFSRVLIELFQIVNGER